MKSCSSPNLIPAFLDMIRRDGPALQGTKCTDDIYAAFLKQHTKLFPSLMLFQPKSFCQQHLWDWSQPFLARDQSWTSKVRFSAKKIWFVRTIAFIDWHDIKNSVNSRLMEQKKIIPFHKLVASKAHTIPHAKVNLTLLFPLKVNTNGSGVVGGQTLRWDGYPFHRCP